MLPRWTVDDLLTRYILEPKLRDVFVEGEFDQEILTKAAKHFGQSDLVVYPSGCLDMDEFFLARHKLTTGNKQRLIALSREVSLLENPPKVVALVDKDLDHFFGNIEKHRNLRWTRYCDIGGYFFSKRFIQEIVVEAGKAKIDNFDIFYYSVIDVARFLFAFRLTNRSMSLNQKSIDISRFLSANGSVIEFDRDEFITRVLNKNSNAKQRDAFCDRLNRWLSELKGDFRLHVRGHDLVNILATSIKLLKGIRAVADPAIIERIFILITDRAGELVEDVS